MDTYYNDFLKMLEEENKEGCVEFALSKLESGELDVVTLYTKILEPSLNNMTCKLKDKKICVWKEHVRTSIVRTILECTYPYLLKEKRKNNIGGNKGKVAIVCPPEEYHEIGARMVADFFELNGFDAIFVGSNTPRKDFIEAIDYIRPKYVAISVTNYYNLVAAKKIIQEIKSAAKYPVKILVGGYAFNANPDAHKQIGADRLLETYDDIKRFVEE